MIITFYSDVRGSAGATSNMCSIATYLALTSNIRIVLWENHLNWNMIADNFIVRDRKASLLHNLYGYQVNGTKELLSAMKTRADIMLDKQLLSYTEELYYKKLYYLPNQINSSYLFEREIMKVLPDLITTFRHSKIPFFIDVQDLEKESSRYIVEQSDIVVYNLTQNFRSFSERKPNLSSSKYRYLIGNYHSFSQNNMKNIIRKYKIDPMHIATIPYNATLLEAFTHGRLIDFIQRNLQCGTQDSNYPLLRLLMGASNMISEAIEECKAVTIANKGEQTKEMIPNIIEGRCEDCYI